LDVVADNIAPDEDEEEDDEVEEEEDEGPIAAKSAKSTTSKEAPNAILGTIIMRLEPRCVTNLLIPSSERQTISRGPLLASIKQMPLPVTYAN
jgi:hypothetical protein